MWIKAFLPLAALLVLCNCQTVVQQVCTMDRQMTTVQPGAQVIIGGLFEIRGMGTNGSGCGKPLSDTMQIFEAARFAINFLNNLNSGSGYGGVKFGLNAYDTCVSASSALGVLEMMFPQSKSSSLFCQTNNTVIAGTIGSLSSSTAISAAALAGQIPVSIISPGATEPQLSDKFRYPTFLRTVPSYAVFAQVLAQLLQQLQWENILVVYTDNAYGRSGYEQLLMAMYNRGLCVSQSLMLDTKGNKDSYKTALTNMGNISTPVAVLISPNSLTKVILQAVDEVPSVASMQWVIGDIDITNDVSSLRRVRGALVVVPRSAIVEEFRTYFTQLLASPRTNTGNPWFADWVEATYGCSLTAGNCPTPTAAQFVQSPWAVPTMKAVFAYAEAVRSICNNGVCSRLTTMTPTEFNSVLFSLGFTIPSTFPVSLRGQTISFDSNGDPQTSDFTVYNYNNRQGSYAFEEIGRFELNSFNLTNRPVLYDSSRNTPLTVNPTATCASLGCENCLVPQNSVSYRYRSGDLVIASLINAHEPSQAPFTCGAGRVSQLAALVAAEWAVQQYKTNNPSQFSQVSLGSLVADVCPDAAVAQGFITDVLSGNNRLMDSSGAVIAASNIQAFVDATNDDQAEIISPIISDYNIPEVMADVSTSMISRGGSTPYFTRAAPSDEVFYSAISNVLQRLGWKYVQVATHMSGVYREMANTFTRVAARYGICVVDVSEYFGDGMMDPYSRTVRRLLSNRDTQVVVVFGDMMAVRGLLTAIGQSGTSSQLQLVAGTDDWGTNPAYIQGLETVASGVIVADLDLVANTAFSSYLQNLTLAQITVNPFLRELFEMTNQCALNPTSQGMYARICTSTDKFNNAYMGKALSVIGGVNAVAGKLHELIADLCGPNYRGLCSSFRSASDLGSRLSEKLTNVTKINGLGISNGEGTTNIMFSVYSQGWKQFAQFSSESQTVLSFNPSTLGNYQGKLANCSGVCMECEYLSTMQTSIYNTGDWLIAGSFAVSNSGPEVFQPFICGDVRTSNGPQYTMAMLYALQQVNAGKAPVSVKGVKFGGWIFDHCGNPGRADLIVSDVYAGFMDRMNVDENKILAWLTDTNESSNETVQILNPLSVATISPSATSDSLMNYQTFFRTIQGDAAAATALIMIAKAMKYNYIQVVYSANAYGRDGLKLLVNTAQSEGVCVTNQLEFTNASDIVTQLLPSETDVVVLFMTESDVDSFLTSASTMATAKSLFFLLPKHYSKIVQRVGSQFTYPILSLQLQKFNLTDYNAYINTSPTTNPFFAKFYMNIMQCNLPGYSTYNTACSTPLQQVTSNANYVEDNYVLSTIDAVYSVVDALHRTISDYCGSDYTKPCSAFLAAANKRQSFNSNLQNVNFVDDGKRSFRYLVREGATTFDILQYSSSVTSNTVGSYSGQSLDISDAAVLKYSKIESTCTPPCLGCIMTGITFSHIPGDIYLAGIFDVHLRSLSPFTCGNIKTLHGFLLLEAFHYAIEQVNAKQGQFANILPGVRLGGVGLDACESDVRGGYLISNIHSGITTLSKDGLTIMPSMIDAYIGSYYSTTSIYIARILTDLKIPQISYGSGSEELSDVRVYPFFYRTVPTDNNQVEAMLKLLDKLDIRYVQVLYEDNSNGKSAMQHFVASATNYSICVAETVAYPDFGTVSAETSATVVAKLIEKPTANTIVTFLDTQYVNSLLRSIAASDKAKDKFRFIGSDSWADNQDTIQGAGSQAYGSITLRLDADDVQAFENYISSKNLANSKDNPWFQDYFQNMLNCYISKTNTMGYPVACPPDQVSLINSPNYQQDSDVVYVINAVYAAAFAIHKTLVSACGSNYNTVCQSYRTNATHHEMIRDNLADVSFTDPVGKNFMFVNRSGVASYRFNYINPEYPTGYTIKTIGSYNVTTSMIMLDGNFRSTVQSDCNRPDACAECPAIRDSGVRYVFHKSTQNVAETIIAFFDIHEQGVDPFRCGDINVAGFQQLVTFFYTLEKVLSNRNYRILVIDTCSNSLRVDQDLYGLLDGTGLCNSDFRFDSTNAVSMKTIGGVVTVGEANTIAAARVLELPGVTYLSPNALTTLLDSKQHLVRTIAPVSAMMKTLVSLLNKLGWTYIDVLYENSAEGIQPFHSFASYANAARVCRGSSVIVDANPGADVQSSLAQLKGDKGSEVVVLFGSYNFVKLVLATANSMSIADRYLWVLGVEWDLTTDALRNLVPVGVEIRLITLRRLTYTVGGFSTYMNSLTYNDIHALNSGFSIPMDWYDEYYQKVFDCRLASFTKSVNISKPVCDTNKQFSSVNLTQDMYTLNLVAATYAVVQGLSDSKMLPPVDSAMSRMNILNSILNVQKDLNTLGLSLNPQDVSTVLKFDTDHRWWDSEYLIKFIRVRKFADGSLDIKEDVLVRGDFNPSAQKISEMKTLLGTTSVCNEEGVNPCDCTYEDIEPPQPLTSQPFTPTEPRNYYYYHNNGEQQYDWSVWAIVVAIITSVGLLTAVILFLILIFAYPVRSGTTVLGYMSIIGIIGIYAINFAFFVHAMEATCGARRFLMGVVYMIAIAPLLIKAVDNWRFSKNNSEKERYSGISSAFVLLMAAIGVVLIQCIIPIIWLILVHPTASEWTPYAFARHDNWWCDPPQDYDTGLVQSFIFVMFIVLVTAVFSTLTFDSDRNNFESRWILLSCIVTAGCFLVWMIVSTSATPSVRDPAVTIGNLVNATLLLLAMPLRKCILLCQHLRHKEELDDANEVLNHHNGQMNVYNDGFDNPMLDLNVYDNYGMNGKPSQY